ncbi:diguanylate cyclase, partial [Escherichia coli]
MPKYPHRNRVTHLLILIIFSSRHISDEMGNDSNLLIVFYVQI